MFEKQNIHFVGIGGIGMSGIAEILFELGYAVQGSDMSDNQNVRRLRDKGISIVIGQRKENIQCVFFFLLIILFTYRSHYFL